MTPALAAASASDLRHVPVSTLRGRLGVMASRGETDSPRARATKAALDWQRNRASFIGMGIPEDQAEDLADQAAEMADAAAEAVAR